MSDMLTMKPPIQQYYSKRAAEYEKIYEKPERQQELEWLRKRIPEIFRNRTVLEVACGTGYWTQFIARTARHVHACDINEPVLEIAREKPLPRAACRSSRPTPSRSRAFLRTCDAAFAGFWWSHVKRSELASFVRNLAVHLEPGAQVAILDNTFFEGKLDARLAPRCRRQHLPEAQARQRRGVRGPQELPDRGGAARGRRSRGARGPSRIAHLLLAAGVPTSMTDDVKRIADRLDDLVKRLDRFLPDASGGPDWKATAFRWRKHSPGAPQGPRLNAGYLEAVRHPHSIRFADLKDVDEQKRRVRENTAQFVAGRPANNVLLTGARGTGKSSLVKAALNEFASKGLRLIEVDKRDLVDMPDIVDLVADRKEKFVIFCDDLSFEATDPGYKSLKVALDGSIAGSADNVLIYATSNRAI
jgi:SAM-dependent methyltransferase